MDDKIQTIKDIYETKFGNAYETYKEAVKINNSIRLQDVKDYLSKRDEIQVKSKPKGSNSFVSPNAKFEFEIDIMDILARDGEGTRYGLVAIDNFTKMADVIPIKNRQPAELIRSLKLIFQSIGKPKQLYSDEEGGFRSSEFIRFLNQNDIKHIQTSTHAATAERFIRTFKDNLYRRLDALKQDKSKWVEHVDNIINKYNNTEHNTIEIKPNEAVKPYNRMWVWWHLQNNSKKDKKYPKINEGDMVRVNIKKTKFSKSHEPNWSSTRYKVVDVRGNQYFIPSINKSKLYLRHELLKV